MGHTIDSHHFYSATQAKCWAVRDASGGLVGSVRVSLGFSHPVRMDAFPELTGAIKKNGGDPVKWWAFRSMDEARTALAALA